jgi:hypothetical protein
VTGLYCFEVTHRSCRRQKTTSEMRFAFSILLMSSLFPAICAEELRVENKTIAWHGELMNGKLRALETR